MINMFWQRKKRYYKSYKSLDDLPMWNWDKLIKGNKLDLKYLLILDDYNDSLKINSNQRQTLKTDYNEIKYQFDKINLPLLLAKRDIIVKITELIIDIFKNSRDIEKMEKAAIILNGLMITDAPDFNWLFQVDFTETNEQKRFLTEIGIVINNYNKKIKRAKEGTQQTLIEKTVKIESLLGLRIDIKICSVSKYMAYENEAIEKIKVSNKDFN